MSLRRRGASGALIAVLASASMVLAACGGGSDNGGGNGGGSTKAAGGDCGSTSPAPVSGSTADAKAVTAADVELPDGTPGKGTPTFKIGGKNFPEEDLLVELYSQALKAKGFSVETQKGIGDSETTDEAFQSGQIDMYPEYLGEIATSVGDLGPQKSIKANYQAVEKFEQTKRNATIFKQTPFYDSDVLFVTPDFCKQYNLKSIADLKKVGPKGKGVKYSAQPPARTRIAGFKGLQQAYGLTDATFVGTPVGQTYQAVDSGTANVGDAFSTDPALARGIKQGKYRTLTDPKHIMGYQYVAPVLTQKLATAGGKALEQTCNWVSSKLTTEAIVRMDTAVQVNRKSAASVAKQFLDANGLT